MSAPSNPTPPSYDPAAVRELVEAATTLSVSHATDCCWHSIGNNPDGSFIIVDCDCGKERLRAAVARFEASGS